MIPRCEVVGTVRDRLGGVIPGADVSLGGRRTVSNAEGKFHYPYVPAGCSRLLRVKLDGFRPWARPLKLPPIMRACTVEIILKVLVVLVALSALAPAPAAGACEPEKFVRPLAQVWLGAQSTYAPGTQRQDVAVGQVNALLPLADCAGLGLRVRTMGAVGTFRPDQPSTFSAAEAFVALHVNLFSLSMTTGPAAGAITGGPTVVAGYAVPLETKDGEPPKLARTATVMLGLRLDSSKWRAELLLGIHQQLAGFAGGASVHVETSEHSAIVVDAAIGSKMKPLQPPTEAEPNPAKWPSYVAAISLVLRP